MTIHGVTHTSYYDNDSTNTEWENAVRNTTTGAYMSIVREGGTITNANYRNVIIKKIVTGNMASINKEFEYTITIYDSSENQISGNITIEKNGTQSTIANGGTITLKHGEQLTVKNILIGYKYSITETDTDYTESYKIESTDNSNIITNDTQGNSIIKQVLNENQSVTFTNNKEKSVLTGIFTDETPYIILVIIAIVGLLVISKKKINNY